MKTAREVWRRIGVQAFFIDFLVIPQVSFPILSEGCLQELGPCGIMLASRWNSSGCITSLWTSQMGRFRPGA